MTIGKKYDRISITIKYAIQNCGKGSDFVEKGKIIKGASVFFIIIGIVISAIIFNQTEAKMILLGGLLFYIILCFILYALGEVVSKMEIENRNTYAVCKFLSKLSKDKDNVFLKNVLEKED